MNAKLSNVTKGTAEEEPLLFHLSMRSKNTSYLSAEALSGIFRLLHSPASLLSGCSVTAHAFMSSA